ncbi:type II toxin-antitoxin system antitoxin, TscA family [Staphylococcus coagulans]
MSREKHLESIMQWAVQQIENNFEIVEEETNE